MSRENRVYNFHPKIRGTNEEITAQAEKAYQAKTKPVDIPLQPTESMSDLVLIRQYPELEYAVRALAAVEAQFNLSLSLERKMAFLMYASMTNPQTRGRRAYEMFELNDPAQFTAMAMQVYDLGDHIVGTFDHLIKQVDMPARPLLGNPDSLDLESGFLSEDSLGGDEIFIPNRSVKSPASSSALFDASHGKYAGEYAAIRSKRGGRALYDSVLARLSPGVEDVIYLDKNDSDRGVRSMLGRAARSIGLKLLFGALQIDENGKRSIPIRVESLDAQSESHPTPFKAGFIPDTLSHEIAEDIKNRPLDRPINLSQIARDHNTDSSYVSQVYRRLASIQPVPPKRYGMGKSSDTKHQS